MMRTIYNHTVHARIADLNVVMHCKTEYMVHRLCDYAATFEGDAQIEIDITQAQLDECCKENPHLDPGLAEYVLSGSLFYNVLYRKYNGMMLHASAIAMDGEGYLFSANSGTGKSTHTDLWRACFGERVIYINDDKPALRLNDGTWKVYGTPWSGKTELNSNVCVPLKSIAFLHRSAENGIERIHGAQALTLMLEQIIRPKTEKGIDIVFSMLDDLLARVPVYSLGCNISQAAAKLAYETMKQ